MLTATFLTLEEPIFQELIWSTSEEDKQKIEDIEIDFAEALLELKLPFSLEVESIWLISIITIYSVRLNPYRLQEFYKSVSEFLILIKSV